MPGQDLQLTGERTLPDISHENYWFMRHVVAYERVLPAVAGMSVIDIGCGEGYGPGILAGKASRVLGVDIASEVVDHARSRYGSDRVSFDVMDVNALAVEDDSFDVAVSFQVVEHLVDVSGYFNEIARVLKPGGKAFLTTPNRLTISPGSDKPINPFHLREYTPDELALELAGHFDEVHISGMFHAGWLALNDRVRLVDFIKVYEMSNYNPRLWAHRALTPLIRARDFRITDGDISGCLDMFAECSTEGAGR